MGGERSNGETHRGAEGPNQRTAGQRGLAAMIAEGLIDRTIRARDGESRAAHHDAGGSADDGPLAQGGAPAGMHGVLGVLIGGDRVKRLGTRQPEDEGIEHHADHDALDPSVELSGLTHGADSYPASHGHQGVGLPRQWGCRTAEDHEYENPSHEDFRRGTSTPKQRETGTIVNPAPRSNQTSNLRASMRSRLPALALLLMSAPLSGQAAGKFPPDSLVNLRVIPKDTPVTQVVGMMRNITGDLGVRCQFCHLGEEGQPLAQFDFASDQKRTKVVARQMMLMVREISSRLDTLPDRPTPLLQVTCGTCHRGTSRPVPLFTLMLETSQAAGADSAIRVYRALRQRYYGRDAFDFGEPSLNIAAFRLGRAQRFEEAFALLRLNEEYFPASSGMYVFRGNINLMRGDTAAAVAAFREAIRRDSTNNEARGRLRAIGRP